MGIAASQARFLALTARQNNVEYEGQQINQQRINLSNQSAVYNNQSLNLQVPTPPSVTDFTTLEYSWKDATGNVSTITELRAITNPADKTGPNGEVYNYYVDYDHTTKNQGTATQDSGKRHTNVQRAGTGGYSIDNFTLTPLDTSTADGRNTLKLLRDASVHTNNTDSPISTDNESFVRVSDGGTPANYTIYSKTELDAYLANPSAGLNSYDDTAAHTRTALSTFPTIVKDPTSGAYTIGGQVGTDVSDPTALGTLRTNSPAPATVTPVEQFFTDNAGNYYSSVELEAAVTAGATAPVYAYDFNSTNEVKPDTDRAYVKMGEDGRLTSITIDGETFKLSANSKKDDVAYEDAMNQYAFDKAEYDKALQDINSKLSIVQAQDKTLEIQLKQLDTEQEAIQTEQDAVQKVITKDIEGSFKTFA